MALTWTKAYAARLAAGVGLPAHDALRLMVDTYEGRKPLASWRRPPSLPLSTLWRSEIAGGHAAAQRTSDDDDDDEITRTSACRLVFNQAYDTYSISEDNIRITMIRV